MYYRCTKCNAAIKTTPGDLEICDCGSGSFIRAERDRIYTTEVYRSGGDHFKLNAARNKFVPCR